MKRSIGAGFSVLLLWFVGAGFVSSDPGPRAVAVNGVQRASEDAHIEYYQAHLATLQVEGFNCR